MFDPCTRLLIIDFDQTKEIKRQEIYLDELSLSERLPILQKLNVTIFICGAISEAIQNMLRTSNNCLIAGIAGDSDKVSAVLLANRFDEAQFQMRGYKPRR